MSAKPAAIPLFGDAYMADTRHLSLEEHGAYLMLLMVAWRTEDCALPDDDKRLARMLGIGPSKWAKLKPAVLAFWTLDNGAWKQARLTKERAFVDEKRATNSSSAKARWDKQTPENKQGGGCERMSERNAPPPPLVEEEKIMPDKSGDYAFFGQTIKLAPRHLNEWKRTFHTILDLEAELSVIDGWWQLESQAEKRSNWFLATKGMLNKRHQQNLATQKAADSGDDGWAMMP